MNNRCRAYKNKTTKLQCTAIIKNGNYCGKHKNFGNPVFDNAGNYILATTNNSNTNMKKQQIDSGCSGASASASGSIHKELENSNLYINYLIARKHYIIETNKHIDILEYMENSKMDNYPYSRILASLEYYKLIQSNLHITQNNKYISMLESFFNLLLKVYLNLDKVKKLQKWIKTSLNKYRYKLHGNAWHTRTLCVNDSDFVSLDNINDISEENFISFRDQSGFTYGFALDSLLDLILKTDDNFLDNFKKTSNGLCYRQYIRVLYNHYNKIKVKNPYTRDLLPGEFKLKVFKLHARTIYFTKPYTNGISNKPTNISSNISTNSGIDIKTRVRNKCLNVFQKIDMLGYMTNTAWLLDENIKNIKLFYKKLAFQWVFEFGLNDTARYKISKNYNLFTNTRDILTSRSDKYILLDKILDTLNILVSNGESESDRATGCIIILYALAYINRQCIESNPWLN